MAREWIEGSIMVPPKTDTGNRGLPILNETAPGITDCMACGDCLAARANKAIQIIRGFRVNKPYFYYQITQDIKFTYLKKY